MSEIITEDLRAVYERIKDRGDLVWTTTAVLEEGFTVDCPIIVGKAHGQIIELYEDGAMFVLDVIDEAHTMGTHWHPYNVDCAVRDILEFMEGKAEYELSPFKQQ